MTTKTNKIILFIIAAFCAFFIAYRAQAHENINDANIDQCESYVHAAREHSNALKRNLNHLLFKVGLQYSNELFTDAAEQNAFTVCVSSPRNVNVMHKTIIRSCGSGGLSLQFIAEALTDSLINHCYNLVANRE